MSQAERLREIENRLRSAVPKGEIDFVEWLKNWYVFSQHSLHDVSWLIRELKVLVVENEQLRSATAVQLGQKAGTRKLVDTSYREIKKPIPRPERRTSSARMPPPPPMSREESAKAQRDREISQVVLDLVSRVSSTLGATDRASFSRDLQRISDPVHTGDILINDDDILHDDDDDRDRD